MRFHATFYLLGRLLLLVGGLMTVPAGVSYIYGEGFLIHRFLVIALATMLTGFLVMLLMRHHKDDPIGVRDGFLLVTLAWLLISIVGAIPFHFSRHFPSFVDAAFESISGFTTTGASVLSNIEALPKGLLFWRSFTHWIGGMGIIVLAVAILPQLSIGGMQFIKNETPGPTFEQLKPRIRQTAISLWKIYVLFSLLEVGALYLCGMPLFDSICHMFGTMGTGGFSTKNASIGAYENPLIQLVIAGFMFLAGMNFVLHYCMLRGEGKKVMLDAEWKFYATLVLTAFIVIGINLCIQAGFEPLKALRLSIFQVLAIVSTTGYVTTDFDAWPHLSKGLLFLLMIVGGCAGSTAGGFKQVRLILLFKRAKQSLMQHIFPKAVVSVKLNRRVVPESVLHGVSSFLIIYLVLFAGATLVLLASNYDFETATSAVVACLSNIGPGFGDVGASQNYAFFPTHLKWILCACMIIGRLEIFTVLVLFMPATWRR